MVKNITVADLPQDKYQRVSQLREELAELFEKREFMVSYERNQLNALYVELIGRLLYEEFALKTDIRKSKRIAELVQTKMNRGEAVDMGTVEQIVEKEFAEYRRQLEEQLNQIKAAQELLAAPMLSEEDTTELKSIYRLLAKRLHPDWNPNQTEREKELFIRAQAAYKSCDLQELRNILQMLEVKSEDELNDDNVDEKIKQLEACLEDIRSRIDKLNETFPFTYKELLKDPKWVEQEQNRIQESINALTKEKQLWSVYASTQMGSISIGQA